MNAMGTVRCTYSFIYVCEELHPAESYEQAYMYDVNAESHRNTAKTSLAHEQALLIADSLHQLIQVKAEDAARYDSVFIRPDGVVEFKIGGESCEPASAVIIQSTRFSGTENKTAENKLLVEEITKACHGNVNDIQLESLCEATRPNADMLSNAKWEASFRWLEKYVSSAKTELDKQDGKIVALTLSNETGKLVENPEKLNSFCVEDHRSPKIKHIVIVLNGSGRASTVDLHEISTYLGSLCDEGPDNIWLGSSVYHPQTETSKLLDTCYSGKLMKYLTQRYWTWNHDDWMNADCQITLQYSELSYLLFLYKIHLWQNVFPDMDAWSFLHLQNPSNEDRQPKYIHPYDYRLSWRGCGGRRGSWIQCDNCEGKVFYSNDVIRYWGGYIEKTWNTQMETRLTKRDVICYWWHGCKWGGRKVNLTWWCVKCYLEHHKCTYVEATERLGVFQYSLQRHQRKNVVSKV